MTVSTPLRRRRQSVRTPQRRVNAQKENEEASFDPFVPAHKKAGEGEILKQTLLAQLNARVSADPNDPFQFSRGPRKIAQPTSVARFEDNHQKIFKSMKPIGPSRSSSSSSYATCAQRPAEHKSQIAVPSPKRRTENQYHESATPSKRRKMESAHSSSTGLPKLAFNFGQKQDKPTVAERAPCADVVKSNLLTDAYPPPVLSTSTKSPAQTPSALHPPSQEPLKDKQRERKRLDQRKKTTVERMLKKTSANRPGWK